MKKCEQEGHIFVSSRASLLFRINSGLLSDAYEARKDEVHSCGPGCHPHILETPDRECEDGTYVVPDGDEVWETILSMGLEPSLLEARCVGTSIDRNHHEEYISILWLILPVGDEEYPHNQEKIIHPIDHDLFPQVYPYEECTEYIDREKYARNRPEKFISMDEFDRGDSEDDHPDELSKWMWDDLSAKNSFPIDNRIHTEDEEGENRKNEFLFH